MYPSQASRELVIDVDDVNEDSNEVDVDAIMESQPEESEEDDAEQVPPTIAEALEELGLIHLQEKFEEEAILTFDDFKDLSVEDLKEMKFKIGERNRLKRYIAKANEPKAQPHTDADIQATKYYASLFDSIDESGSGKGEE